MYNYLCLASPSGAEEVKALIQTKAKALFNGDREPALCRVKIALTSINTRAILSLPRPGRQEL